jgi:hypothetical protein
MDDNQWPQEKEKKYIIVPPQHYLVSVLSSCRLALSCGSQSSAAFSLDCKGVEVELDGWHRSLYTVLDSAEARNCDELSIARGQRTSNRSRRQSR